MKLYDLFFEQRIPCNSDEAWDFFSSPGNLSKITPSDMNFVITSRPDGNSKIYPGMIITYEVSPIKGVKMNWVTEITHIKQNEYFIDEQRLGPYGFWQHQHHFEKIEGGIKMIDKLYYALPYGILGRLANSIFAKNELKKMFSYRTKKIEEIFGIYKETGA